MIIIEIRPEVKCFIQNIVHKTPVDLFPLSGGANNQVFKVNFKDIEPVLLKHYFSDPIDERNRLKHEFLFLKYAWSQGIRVIPEPLGCDNVNKFALLQYIDGIRPKVNQITESEINNAISFFLNLNKCLNPEFARILPSASEACFSLQEHVVTIKKRLNKLKLIEVNEEIDNDALSFVQSELIPFWNTIEKNLSVEWETSGINPEEVLPIAHRCISPSDFGFHNSIKSSEGKIFFIDFEYAGWDDPAKMICDFFCQPEVPVSDKYLTVFINKILNIIPDSVSFKQRVSWLIPVYKIKWCCIILNEFLPISQKRRSFADIHTPVSAKKRIQLKKSQELLIKTKSIYNPE